MTTQLTYTAAVLTKVSRKRLLEQVPALHAKVLADHITLVRGPTDEELESFEEGAVVKFQVTGSVVSEGVQAVTVRGLEAQSGAPHVTVSLAEGHTPKESLDLLRGSKPRMLKSFVLEATLKVFSH